MIRFLRRHQPRALPLAILYWTAITLAVLAGLFTIFFYVDNFLPGQGMF